MQELKIIKSRERSRDVENRRQKMQEMKMMNNLKKINIDRKIKKITVVAKQHTFKNSTLRQSSQFKRVKMKIALNNQEKMTSKIQNVIHHVDSISDKKRDCEQDKKRERESRQSSNRKRRNQEREQTTMSKSKKT